MHLSISIIMPVGETTYLDQALISLKRQSFSDWDLVLVDDGANVSREKLRNMMFGKKITIVSHKKKLGVAKSLNHGLKYVRGDFIARMDADDVAHPKRFEAQIQYLLKHPNTGLIGSAARLISSDGRIIGTKQYPSSNKVLHREILKYNPFIHPTTMWRRSVQQKVGNYDESLNGAEDYDLFLRIAQNFEVANLSRPLLDYRVSRRAVSWNNMKKIELQSLKTRWRALTRYGYPMWQMVYLLKPALSYLVPTPLKRAVLKKIWKIEN